MTGSGATTGRATREWWRRGLHVASGLLGPLAAAQRPHVATVGFALLVLVAAACEVARQFSPRGRAFLERLAGGLFRPAESRGVSGATTLAVGYALAWWVFPAAAAERAIVVAAVADPVAASVGSRVPGGAGKTWTGTAACACAAALALLPTGAGALAVVAAAVAAAAAERAPWRGADNLTVPAVVAAVLWALA